MVTHRSVAEVGTWRSTTSGSNRRTRSSQVTARCSEEPWCAPSPPQGTLTDARLAGTGLRQHFLDCSARFPDAIYFDREGNGVCTFYAGDSDDPVGYAQCIDVGGGQIVDETGGYYCKIVYSEVARPCFGNSCD
jgi:hypothetical protein